MQKDGAFLILFKNDKRNEVFLVRRDDYYVWVLTGGGIEKGEKPLEAAVRETQEETGFKVKVLRLLGVYEIVNKKRRSLRKSYLYEGRVLSGSFKPEFPGCLGKWFSIQNLPRDMARRTKGKIFDAISHQQNSAFRKKWPEGKIWENIHLLFLHPIGALKYLFKKTQ